MSKRGPCLGETSSLVGGKGESKGKERERGGREKGEGEGKEERERGRSNTQRAFLPLTSLPFPGPSPLCFPGSLLQINASRGSARHIVSRGTFISQENSRQEMLNPKA